MKELCGILQLLTLQAVVKLLFLTTKLKPNNDKEKLQQPHDLYNKAKATHTMQGETSGTGEKVGRYI